MHTKANDVPTVPELRAEWDALAARARAASARCTAAGDADDDELYEIDARRDACAQRILAEAASGQAAIRLAADAAFWVLYGADLSNGPETDMVLAGGPSEDKVCNEALAALFRVARAIAA